jgi:hypothetical protein
MGLAEAAEKGPVDEVAFVDKVEFGATVLTVGDPRPGPEAPVAEDLASFEASESINPPGSGLILQNIKFTRNSLFEKQPSRRDLRACPLHRLDSRGNLRSCAMYAVRVCNSPGDEIGSRSTTCTQEVL